MIFSNDGVYALYSSNSTASDYTLNPGIVSSVATNGFSRRVNGAMGVWLMFYGVGSNNSTGNFRVNGVNELFTLGSGRPNPSKFYRWNLGAGTFTFSSSLTGDGTVIPSSNYIADTVTYTLSDASTTTPKGPGTQLETSYSLGNAGVISPADDTYHSWVFIPMMGFVGYIEVEAIVGGGSPATSVNVLAVLAGVA